MKLLFDFLFILGILLSCIYIIVLYKNDKGLPHKILISILVIFIFVLINYFGIVNNNFAIIMLGYAPAVSAKIVIGALIFLYVNSLFFNYETIIKKYWGVLIPPLLFFILYALPALIADVSNTYFLYHLDLSSNYEVTIIRAFSNFIALMYLILSFNSFLKLKKVMKSTYSSMSHNNFIWIRFFIICPIGVISLDFLVLITDSIFNVFNGADTEIITVFSLVVSIIYMAYFGLNQTKVLVPYFLLETDTTNNVSKKKQIDPAVKVEFDSLEKSVKYIFETEKPYLDRELTLGKLASIVGVSDKKLSSFLNQHIQISFYEFVNGYRVEAFKKALRNNKYKDYTIEGVGYECGFKSKASFYRIFKAKNNMSPAEFKKSIR